MPEVVTHPYDPAQGAWLNLCSLPDFEASRVLDRLRRESRPNLKPNYLARRRAAEQWLSEAASASLGRAVNQRPVYFFLGDFSCFADHSRPAAMVLPLSILPTDAITFTLGDSMRVAEEPTRQVYNLKEMSELFARGEAVSRFGMSDHVAFQAHFIEVQVWDTARIGRQDS